MNDYSVLINNIYEQGFHIQDNFLPKETYDNLRQTAISLGEDSLFQSAKIGSHDYAVKNHHIRQDKIHWLDEISEDPFILSYLSTMNDVSTALNEALYLGLVTFETHFSVYPAGAFYKKHIDQFHHNKDRQISCVFYLNNEWQPSFGGELLLYDEKDTVITRVEPVANRLICFKSDIPHEVCPTTEMRLSIAGWMKTRSLGFFI